MFSGLVVTLDPEMKGIDQTTSAIRTAGPFTIGQRLSARLPLAVQAATPQDLQHWHDWLRELPGVVKVDVAFVSFEEEPACPLN